MAQKKKLSLSRTIIKIVTIVPTIINMITHLTHLIGYEARLAGRSLVILLVLALFAGSLCTIIWITLLGLLYMYFITLHWSGFLSLFVILMLNIFILIIVLLIMSKVKNKLTFPMTRDQFRNLSDQ